MRNILLVDCSRCCWLPLISLELLRFADSQDCVGSSLHRLSWTQFVAGGEKGNTPKDGAAPPGSMQLYMICFDRDTDLICFKLPSLFLGVSWPTLGTWATSIFSNLLGRHPATLPRSDSIHRSWSHVLQQFNRSHTAAAAATATFLSTAAIRSDTAAVPIPAEARSTAVSSTTTVWASRAIYITSAFKSTTAVFTTATISTGQTAAGSYKTV